MKYKLIKQEREDWCVPACLQMILPKLSQEEIAKGFPKKSSGLEFNLELLNKFLHSFNLSSSYYNPFLDLVEADLFLRDSKGHILAAYDFTRLSNNGKKDGDHISIVEDYNPVSDFVRMVDPSKPNLIAVNLDLLVRSMHPDLNNSYGFYNIR